MEAKPPLLRLRNVTRSNSFTIRTKKSARSLKPEREQDVNSAKPEVTSLNNLNEDTTPKNVPEVTFLRPLKRISRTMKISQTPSYQRFDLWEHYEDKWFEIRTSEIKPLFSDIPLPKTKEGIKEVDTAEIQKEKLSETGTQSVLLLQPLTVLQPATMLQPKYSPRIRAPSTARRSEGKINLCLLCSFKNGKSYLSCGHYFCKECLYSYIKIQMESRSIPIICPRLKCGHELSKHEVTKNICYTTEINKYFDLSMEVFIEKCPHKLVQCFNPRCTYVFDMTRMKRKDILRCPKCRKSYCVRCHGVAHPRLECEDVPNSRFKVSENEAQYLPAIFHRPASHR